MDSPSKSASSDCSWEKLAIPYEEFDVLISDVNESDLESFGEDWGCKHLAQATFPSLPFPVSGFIHGRNIRYMVPLVCQRYGKSNSKSINVWFLVDTGSPFTCLSLKSLEALLGSGQATKSFYMLAIQDQQKFVECQISKAHFQEVNILGADSLKILGLSIDVDWDNRTFKLIKK